MTKHKIRMILAGCLLLSGCMTAKQPISYYYPIHPEKYKSKEEIRLASNSANAKCRLKALKELNKQPMPKLAHVPPPPMMTSKPYVVPTSSSPGGFITPDFAGDAWKAQQSGQAMAYNNMIMEQRRLFLRTSYKVCMEKKGFIERIDNQ